MAERKALTEWGLIVTILLAGIFLAFSGVVAHIVGWLLILLGIALAFWWWPDLRRLWQAAGLEDLEVIIRKHEEDHIGFMSGFNSTPTYLFSNVTALLASLSEIQIINHRQTAPTEVLGLRLGVFDLDTGQEIQPSEPPEVELKPVARDARCIPAGESRRFYLQYKADFPGYISRENPSGHVFLMVKLIGSKDELKIAIDEDFFDKPTRSRGRRRSTAPEQSPPSLPESSG